MEDIIKKNSEQRAELLKLRYQVSRNNIETIALIINELYSLEIAIDIELKVLIQEEDYGSLFTKPHFLIKSVSHPDLWFKKDINFLVQGIPNDSKNLGPNKLLDLDSFKYKEDLGWSDNVINLINHLSTIIGEYDWRHFRNIGRIQDSPLWKSYQDEDKSNTKEYVWIGSLSPTNYVRTLSVISWNVSEEEIKELVINHEKERLEKELSINNNGSRIKSKI